MRTDAYKAYVGEGVLYGVDINTGGIVESLANFVWEPAVVKSESAQGDTVASAMGGRGRGGVAFRGHGRGMRR
ncbi:hypothetical protein HHK36_004140 [Tetracentron sinense]|uniref:Uncharacterized protein n=1 Tax=Tetracentron sinense TaxID=13715 RepID=A0A834ZPJ0_TETSI|nr:hypothetical protein HHK36_004140 [Tetracentron sinense]